MPSDITSFQCVRARASAFCKDREWHNFHTPVNLALALSGECGEISEIFQWKGPLENGVDNFTAAEKVHIGEEIADVMIYSTRLCDLCGIDLAYSVRYCSSVTSSLQYKSIKPTDTFIESCSSSGTYTGETEWDKLNFAELDDLILVGLKNPVSPRAIALSIQSRCGQVCELFLSKSESQSVRGLPDWPRSEVAELALIIGTICLLLSRLARTSGNTLSNCVSDKFKKNDAKYPAEMVKGSSAKYTSYVESIEKKKKGISQVKSGGLVSREFIVSAALLGTILSLGFFFGIKLRRPPI
jgi:NTP pyrophosphatase (non-canonical NTP hydrolase)